MRLRTIAVLAVLLRCSSPAAQTPNVSPLCCAAETPPSRSLQLGAVARRQLTNGTVVLYRQRIVYEGYFASHLTASSLGTCEITMRLKSLKEL